MTDKSVIGGALSKDSIFPSFSSDNSQISGEINSRILERMTAYHRLANLLKVEGKISCNVKVPLIFELHQVDLELVKHQNISFEISDDRFVLFLKALIDTGSSDTFLGENLIGKVIRDKGVKVPVSSILDDSQVYHAGK